MQLQYVPTTFDYLSFEEHAACPVCGALVVGRYQDEPPGDLLPVQGCIHFSDFVDGGRREGRLVVLAVFRP